MPQNARVAEKWLCAAKGVQICAADTDTMDAHQCLAGAWPLGRGCAGAPKLARLLEDDRLHFHSFSITDMMPLRLQTPLCLRQYGTSHFICYSFIGLQSQ